MLNPSASLAMSTSALKALHSKLDIKRHSPTILYIQSKWIAANARFKKLFEDKMFVRNSSSSWFGSLDLTLACWVILHTFDLMLIFFQNQHFEE